MKNNFSVIAVFFIAFLVLFSYSAQSQEESQNGQPVEELKELNASHPELNLDEDKTLILEADHKANTSPAGLAKEAIPTKGAKTKEATKVEKEEEDALSFNFLYYIIQKFKIGDIVDN
jgi:hypothetical protein